MFAELKKTPKLKAIPEMPLEVRECSELMILDTWLGQQIKRRKTIDVQHPEWSKEKREGYEHGIIDAFLDVKNEIKRLINDGSRTMQ